jgi:glutathione S-transferase
MVSAIELGLDGQIEKIPAQVSPIKRTAPVIADNPLGKVPTLIDDDGNAMFDSRVICEYLDSVAGGGRLFPAPGAARWRALTEQSLADGMTDAALLERYETTLRPPALMWPEWRDGQHDKVVKSLDRLERTAADLAERVDIGTISIGCALAYLDFRFADLGWRDARPRLAAWYATFAKRPAMAATEPKA